MVTDPLIGRLIDSRYKIVDRVARGGMATVYRANDRRLDRQVALKLMHAHLADSPDFVSRFRREARAAARLSNPGVVAVYDQGSLEGVAYLVMEYVEGPTLRDLIASGPLSVKEALGLVAQVLRPLGAAHRAGLVHRDIKPENVLLPSDGSVAKVADFGLARAVTEVAQTTTGNVLGTVAYLAPELITSGASTSRADVFSTGIVLYELLTGEQPFTADSPIQIAFRNVHEDVPLPSALVPEMPADVDELVAMMTRRSPEDRPEDADAALALLRSVVEELSASELAVRRGGGTGSVRTQTAMSANAQAARAAIADSPQDGEDSQPPPHAGMRTISLPIGSIGPRPEQRTRRLLLRSGSQDAQRTHEITVAPVRSAGSAATAGSAGSAGGSRPERSGRASGAGAAAPLRSRRAVVIGAALAITATSASAAWFFNAGPGRRIPVPDIVGMGQDEARSAVEAEGLVWSPPTRDYSDTVPAGSVISCEPGVGQRVAPGRAITAVVSRGVQTTQVPDLAGKTEEEARAALEAQGLSLGEVTQDYSADVAAGQIISSDPTAGRTVNHSTSVSVVVSQGKRPTTVPDVASMSKKEATEALEKAGLRLGGTSEAYSDEVSKGKVVSSSPAAGASASYGDSVDLVISKGPEQVAVPDVTGMSEDDAKETLEDAGFKVDVKRRLGGAFDSVRSTDPAPGTRVKPGSTVTIYVW
ncbi:Stk1 family PASTA domain-containing Ser/Thr kinase [Actinomyces bowdenii]|uniref:Stk1 family PASTA domain-containing Ser/Thr kinase n=1 Tax=Actinomyces bowdenii TaxID=131109 RepID=UPI00214A98A7|nr:Stk1 family PASTA domain-containing Ser/Thr kinase [Actinomyces bowdenii]